MNVCHDVICFVRKLTTMHDICTAGSRLLRLKWSKSFSRICITNMKSIAFYPFHLFFLRCAIFQYYLGASAYSICYLKTKCQMWRERTTDMQEKKEHEPVLKLLKEQSINRFMEQGSFMLQFCMSLHRIQTQTWKATRKGILVRIVLRFAFFQFKYVSMTIRATQLCRR